MRMAFLCPEQLDSSVPDNWFRLKESVFQRSDCRRQRIQYLKNRYQQKALSPDPGTEFSDAIGDLHGKQKQLEMAPACGQSEGAEELLPEAHLAIPPYNLRYSRGLANGNWRMDNGRAHF